MDASSEAKLANVAPQLAEKVRQIATRLAVENIEIRVTQGLRTADQQNALYAQGRTKPGNKVTNAPAGYSWHEFGLAVDLVPDDPSLAGFQCDWNVSHPAWKRIVEVGESVGLTSGISWGDEPHLQMQGRFPVAHPTDETRQILRDGGIEAVWTAALG